MTKQETDISSAPTGYHYGTTTSFSKNKMENALSAEDRLKLLSAVWQSITAIEHLKSVASSVRSVTEASDIIKTIQSGSPVLLNTLNDIQASLLLKIEKDAEINENEIND